MTSSASGDDGSFGLVVERRGAIALFRIDRPESRNALSDAVMEQLGNALHDADHDPGVRAVILTATGDRAFSAGMDLREFAARGGPSAVASEGVLRFRSFLRNGTEKPLVGAANATAVAGGFELLLMCDVIVASDAARFGLPEVKRGLFAAGGGVLLLGRWLPPAVALELTLTGDPITAERAHELGLVNRVVPADRVVDEAVELAERIAANGPLGLAATKRLVRASGQLTLADAWALQDELRPGVFTSADAQEGARAFVERRPPNWTGR